MQLSLPPRYTNTPATAVFDADLPDPLFRTLTQLHGLAWQTNGQVTQPFTFEALAELRGLRVRQIRSHLSELESRRLIEIERLGGGTMRVYLKGNRTDPAVSIDIPPTLASCAIPAPAPEPIPTPALAPISPRPEPVRSVPQDTLSAPAPTQVQTDAAQSAAAASDPSTAVESAEVTELAGEIAQIFIGDGDLPGAAMSKARRLIARHGFERCEQQLLYFPLRVERAEASPAGLRNPSGLYIRSVSENWDPPLARKPAKPVKTWYSEEEYELLIIH
jgi:hypothetical protein